MTIQQSLMHQYDVTHRLGTTPYQFALSHSDIMKLGRESLLGSVLPPDRVSMASRMAITGEIETGTTFMGVPVVASGK